MNKVQIRLFHRKCIEKYCSVCAIREDCHEIEPNNFDQYMHDRYPTARNEEEIKAIYDDCFP